MTMRFSWPAGLLLALMACGMAVQAAAPMEPMPGNEAERAALVEAGRRIYVEGILGSGQALEGQRGTGAPLRGTAAACVSCHRASGMGSVEGNLRVPPIGRRYMFATPGDIVMANMDGIRGKTLNRSHPPYTDASMDRALREGVNANEATMSMVMPRFALQAQDLAALKAYLMQLSDDYSPGVTREIIRFATVITPDVTPERRKVFLDMLQTAMVMKNSSTSPRKRYMTSAANFVSQSERRWDVQVWELSGAPETWAAQLDARYQSGPVFALLSGLSESTWAPMDDFCRRQSLPCWFPSVPLTTAGEGTYGLYFSPGVVLEAGVLARHLTTAGGAAPRVLQVYANTATGQQAAQALRQALGPRQTVQDRVLAPADPARALREALAQARAGDVLALWLPAAQWPLLKAFPPPAGVQVYLSGSLGNPQARAALAPAWKAAVRLIYPYALPGQREANLAYLHSWLKLRDIPLVDEEMQSELFFSLNLMTDTLQDMIDNIYRDYLVERTEDMLGKRETSKAEQENRDRRMLGRVARDAVAAEAAAGKGSVMQAPNAEAAQRRAYGLGQSEGTTVYPRLSLGPGQHFASKGAYIVRFTSPHDSQLLAESEWIVP